MRKFKKGQKVWWDDPAREKSGEYDVLAVDYAKNIVKIGSGKETFELSPEHVEITCPVSEEDRLQLDKLGQHYRMLEKDMLELMTGSFPSRGIPCRFATRITPPAAFTVLRWTTGNCTPSWITKAGISARFRPRIYTPGHSLRLSVNWSKIYKTSYERTLY